MLGEFDFHLLQLQHIKAAMDQIATFRPILMTPAQMQTEYDNGVTMRTEYQSKKTALNLARGELAEKQDDAHQTAIGVYGVMKTRYRKDPGSLDAINNLPTKDQTVEETRVRMEMMTALWSQLPNDPFAVPPGPFVAWAAMNQAAFDAKLATMKTAQAALVAAVGDFEMAEGDLHAKDAHMADLAVAGLEEGRSQFAVGTPEREVIDAIPIEPATQEPNQAVISVATSPAAGQAHLEFDALHATSFDVLHKGPGDIDFTTVADDAIEKVYNATGLAAGNHEYKVIGQNSRGNGLESAVAPINVAAPGTGPAPVTLSGQWDVTSMKASLSWTASTDANLMNYTIRKTLGVPYDDNNDTLVATLSPTQTSLLTQDGLFTPGSIVTFKVFVVLTSGAEAGSNPVTIQRP